MPNITGDVVKSDIIDRMDNAVLKGELSDTLRTKLISPNRLLHAVNQAYLQFAKQADPAALQQLTSSVSPTVEKTSGDGSLNIYTWPSAAFQERVDGGIVSVDLDGVEFALMESAPLQSVRMQASSAFYGATQKVFSFSLEQKRLYVPAGVTVSTRVISAPDKIDTLNSAPDAGETNELLIDEVYLETISLMAMSEMTKASLNPNNLGILGQDGAARVVEQDEE